MVRASTWLVISLVAVASASCWQTIDLSKAIQVLDVSTGWYDAGVSEGKNKLVPSITFKIKNASDQKLAVFQVNALFKRGTETDEWGSDFKQVAGSEGFPGG